MCRGVHQSPISLSSEDVQVQAEEPETRRWNSGEDMLVLEVRLQPILAICLGFTQPRKCAIKALMRSAASA